MKKAIIAAIACLLLLLAATGPAIAKNVIKIGGDVTVESDQKVGSVIDIAGQVTINGQVDRNVFAIGGSVVLTNYAVVQGDVVCVGGIVVKGNTAQVMGDIVEINYENISAAVASLLRGEIEGWSLILNIISLCFTAVIFVIALLVMVFIPRPLLTVATEIKDRKVKSFVWGFLATLMIAPFFMLLVFSIIGITLIPLAFAIMLLALIFGYIAAGLIIGDFVMAKITKKTKASLYGHTILGLILLWIIGYLPYAGWLVKMLALTFGLGGVLLTLFNHKQHPLPPQAPPAKEEPPAGANPAS